uniref:Uncharacterized protein n=1 Tax=Lotharella globosa TaxID=91324 RepID=A0A7S4DP40_9EUKA
MNNDSRYGFCFCTPITACYVCHKPRVLGKFTLNDPERDEDDKPEIKSDEQLKREAEKLKQVEEDLEYLGKAFNVSVDDDKGELDDMFNSLEQAAKEGKEVLGDGQDRGVIDAEDHD